MTPKVLHVVGVMDRWSVETWLLQLMAHAARRGQPLDWTFYCAFGQPGARDCEARALGARVVRSPVPIGDKLAFVKALRAEVAGGDYDVLHSHHDLISGVYLLAAAGLRVPKRIVHVHNLDEAVLTPSPLKQAMLRPALRRICLTMADQIVANSDQSLDTFLAGRRRDPRRHRVQPIAVDPARFVAAAPGRAGFRRSLGLAEDAPILLFASRMTPEKNPVFAVDVLAALRRRMPQAVGVFAGAGSLEAEVRARAAELGQTDAIRHDRLARRRRRGDERLRLVHPAAPAPSDGGVRHRGRRGATGGPATVGVAGRLGCADPARRGLAAALAGRWRRRLGGGGRGSSGRAAAAFARGRGSRAARLADGPRPGARRHDGAAWRGAGPRRREPRRRDAQP